MISEIIIVIQVYFPTNWLLKVVTMFFLRLKCLHLFVSADLFASGLVNFVLTKLDSGVEDERMEVFLEIF